MSSAHTSTTVLIPPDRPPLPRAHGPELRLICLSVALERLGSCLVLSLLVLYLNEAHGVSQGAACDQLGWLLFGCYALSILGGWLCDRASGPVPIAVAGSIAVALGTLALLSPQSSTTTAALGLFAFGSGLYKPAMPALLGELHPVNGPRREAAFAHYYTSVNVGALAGPLLAESLRHRGASWSAAFSLAAACFLASGFLLWRARWVLANHPISTAHCQMSGSFRGYARTILLLLATLPLWVLLAQPSGALMFFARDHIGPLNLYGLRPFTIPPGAYLSLHAALVVGLMPLSLSGFGRLRSRGSEMSDSTRVALGLLLAAASCLVLVIASLHSGDRSQIHPAWLLGFYVVLSSAEVCALPAGVSLIGRCMPTGNSGLTTALWFGALALSQRIGGALGFLWEYWPHHRFFLLLFAGVLSSAIVWCGLCSTIATVEKQKIEGCHGAA